MCYCLRAEALLPLWRDGRSTDAMKSTWLIWALTALAGLIVLGPLMAYAQPSAGGTSYITPFPEGDTYQIRVVGDSLAEGLLGAMNERMAGEARVQINRRLWTMNRITINRFDNELAALLTDLQKDRVHIAVIMLGVHERRNIRAPDGVSHRFGTREWRTEYARRVDLLMKGLKSNGIAVYWLGAPTMRSSGADADTQIINDVIRERAYLNGLKYIDTVASFSDGQEGYSAYGPDLSGKISLLRWRDGVHFTYRGYEKLAHFLERELKRDLAAAKSERSIPLAGSEEEQERLRALTQQNEQGGFTGWGATIDKDKTRAAGSSDGSFFMRAAGGEQKEDNTRITLKTIGPGGRENVVPLEIVRPAIPASVVALVSRKQSVDRPTPMGAVLVDQIAGGLNIMSSVSSADETVADGQMRKASPVQTPFFRVLVKGERLEARPGRADDFSWPRPEPEPMQQSGSIDLDESGTGAMPLPGASPLRPRT